MLLWLTDAQNVSCVGGESACDTGNECYADAGRCDGKADCFDNSDEELCESGTAIYSY